MKPETATKLAAMGDIKANKEKLRVALEEAKKNPEAPQSVELRRRLERGMFNAELQALGKKPFPVQVPKVDMGKALAGATQGQQSVVKEPASVESLMDLGEGVVEGAKTFMQGGREIVDTATRDDRTLAEKATMIGGKAFQYGSAGVGELVLGAIKAVPGVTPEVEQATADLVQKAVSGVAETEIVQDYSNWYNSLDERSRDQVNAAGGFAAGLIDLLGIKAGETGARVLKEGVEAGAPVAAQGAEAAAQALGSTARAVGTAARAVTPDTSKMAQSLIANINRINPSKRQEFRMMQGKSEEEWLLERGIVGSREETIKKLADNFTALRQNVDDAMAMVPGTFRDNRVIAVADESVAHAKAVESPELAEIQALANKARSTGVTMSEMNRLKRYYERNIKVGYLKDPTKTAEAVQLATNRDSALREYQFEMADKAGFDNLRQLNKEIQANKFLADEIAGKMEGQGANNLMSLTDWIVATPGITTDPSFLAGFVAKKFISSEFMKVAAAKVLAGFPKQKPLPRADLDEIEKRAQVFLQKQEAARAETEQMALLADELQKSGFMMGEGTQRFIVENPIALSRNEQALIKAAKNRAEQQQIVQYILEMRSQGKAVGEGFTMQNIDNVPILNPRDRFKEKVETPHDE